MFDDILVGRSSRALRYICAACALSMLSIAGIARSVHADSGVPDPVTDATLAGEVAHAQRMRTLFPDGSSSNQQTPPVIPKLEQDPDPTGIIATFQPSGPTQTQNNAFFQNLGTNDRTCFTCHQPEDGWTVSAQHAQERFDADPNDPLFRLVDGATCPSDDVSTPGKRRKAFDLLLNKGLIRIGVPMPSSTTLQFQILSVNDPYNCNTNSTTGLTSPAAGVVSSYRRPLPSTNLGFLSTIMWDGREPSLFSQAVDATLTHAQASAAPSAAQQQQIVTFEGCTTADTPSLCGGTPANAGVFTAQIVDKDAGFLAAVGARGGPLAIAQQLTSFFIGINDPLGNNPKNIPFTSIIFNLYDAWANLAAREADARGAIARGEQVFNTVPINITGVGGLNDVLNQPTISGFCGTCHDTPNAGNHSVKAPLNIGIADAGSNAPPVLDISGLPVFTVWCTKGPLAGEILQVTDIGRATITGQCADIGKLKGPILRGLAARAPYFHNGSAATLDDVVEFYDQRFSIGLTDQQKSDLVAFLKAL
jgi:cytochrome c peroxidase